MTDYSKITALYHPPFRWRRGQGRRARATAYRTKKYFGELCQRAAHLTNIRHYIDDDRKRQIF